MNSFVDEVGAAIRCQKLQLDSRMTQEERW